LARAARDALRVVVIDLEVVALRLVPAAGRAAAFLRIAVEEQLLALVAEAPIGLHARRRRRSARPGQRGQGHAGQGGALAVSEHGAPRRRFGVCTGFGGKGKSRRRLLFHGTTSGELFLGHRVRQAPKRYARRASRSRRARHAFEFP
jgi:hypothetical protein